MDTRTVLSKVVTLIYTSRLTNNLTNDELVKTVLGTIKTDSPEFNFLGNNSIKKFKDACHTFLEEKEVIPKETFLPQLQILLENDQKLFGVIKETIEQQHDDSSLKRIITNLVKTLNNYYREHLASEIFSKASYDLKFNRNKIGNFADYLRNTLSELEPLSAMVTSLKDPAIVGEVDFERQETLDEVFGQVKKLNDGSGVYRTGWQDVNEMWQGGGRRGETIGIGALQHKYKTGFSMSIFAQFARLNAPILTPEEVEQKKKPLILRISLEDDLTNNLQFLYQYLKANEGTPVTAKEVSEIPTDELSKYVKVKMTETGFHLKMIRADPNMWTYSHVVNKVIEFEAQGYTVHIMIIDYLLKLPTTGCTQGAAGQDKRDMLRRMRNFCSARKILFVTPLQLSTEAKQLIRNGVPEHQFVNEVAERGYFDSCKTLDQELDLEVYIHLFTHKRKKYLAIRRGKHRLPTVISDEAKYTIYRFPSLNVPILEDVNGERNSFRTLPKDFEDGSESSILDEVLG